MLVLLLIWTNSKPAIGLLILVEDMSFLLRVQRSDRLNNTSRWNDKLSIWKFDNMKLWLTNKVICTLDCRHKSYTQVVCRFDCHVYACLSISLITAWVARQEGNNRKSDFSASLTALLLIGRAVRAFISRNITEMKCKRWSLMNRWH